MISIILILIFITLTWFYSIKPFSYWSDRNVKADRAYPIFGNCLNLVLKREAFFEMMIRIYNIFPNQRYFGQYTFSKPMFFIKSPELIKQICVKDFDHFQDHRTLVPDGIDELWTKTIFSLRGESWRNMRCTLSPLFTGSKIKTMFVMTNQIAKKFSEHFLKEKNEIIEVEFKDVFGRYTIDVLAGVSFGIKTESLTDRDNDFYVMGGAASSLNTLYTITVFFLYLIAPTLTSIFRLPSVKQKGRRYFIETVKHIIKMREEQNIKLRDILGILMTLKHGQKLENTDDIEEVESASVDASNYENKKRGNVELTDDDILSQVFNFFLGGYETVSNSICFLAYELAVNSEVQQKLIEEIDESLAENSDPSYESIMKLSYMDMVVSEALRKWPVVVGVDRVVTKPYTIQAESADEVPIELKVGDILIIPIIALQRDPKYYPDPMKFDPERFSAENKRLIDSYTYLPFGVGPRDCIGKRFALVEIKAIFFHILSNFEIVPVSKTEIPLRSSKTSLNILPENLTLGLRRRHHRENS